MIRFPRRRVNRRNRRALSKSGVNALPPPPPESVPVLAVISGGNLIVTFSRAFSSNGAAGDFSGCDGLLVFGCGFGSVVGAVVTLSLVFSLDSCVDRVVDFVNGGGWKDDLGRPVPSFQDFPISV